MAARICGTQCGEARRKDSSSRTQRYLTQLLPPHLRNFILDGVGTIKNEVALMRPALLFEKSIRKQSKYYYFEKFKIRNNLFQKRINNHYAINHVDVPPVTTAIPLLQSHNKIQNSLWNMSIILKN